MLSWLNSLEGKPWNLSLDRITALLKKLGNPHTKIKTIHVAGTTGKGSACAMLASILRAAGYKTGLYTSPHLRVLNERIQIDGKMISNAELEKLLKKIKKEYTNQTHFEVLTAAALLYFAEQKVDIAVIETGLGGRLDATNVIIPLISVITTISLEHTAYLGETLEKIASEKVGIIKRGVTLVTMARGKALRIIKRIAKERKSRCVRPLAVRKRGGYFDIGKHKNLFINLLGDFQVRNAALALAAIGNLPLRVPERAIADGLASVEWPGRMEQHGKVLLDCAHNPEGISTLKKEVMKFPHERIIGVVGILNDKDRENMMKILSSFCDSFIFAEPHTERATPAEELNALTSAPSVIVKDVNKAIRHAETLAGPDDIILVTGSIYLVGEVDVKSLYTLMRS